jgi:hypothetical protein
MKIPLPLILSLSKDDRAALQNNPCSAAPESVSQSKEGQSAAQGRANQRKT